MSSLRRSSLVSACATMAVIALLGLVLVSCGDDSSPTGNNPPENRAPDAPAIDTAGGAPADAATGVSVGVVLRWTCSDPDGDDLTYDVHLGTDANPPMVSADQTGPNFDPTSLTESTKYYWQIVATDPDGESGTSPVWSFTTADIAVETVSKPSVPAGPATGETGEDLSYTATGAVSSFGLPVQYRFDWGDGNTSGWSSNTTTSVDDSHSWAVAGSYDVKVQARSSRTPAIESDWSDARTVEITAPAETITITNRLSGPTNLGAGETGIFEMVGFVNSSEGHATEWRYVWGDGTSSDWTTARENSHSWDSEGTYDIGLQGRCIEHPTATHERLDMASVEVAASETISAPTRVDGLYSSNVSNSEYFISANAESSFGHDVELRYDFGDGEVSDWHAQWTRVPHSWSMGSYDIRAQARCVDHPEIVSEWGASRTAVFRETLLMGSNKPVGPRYATVGVPVEFSMEEATCSEGHAVEYTYIWKGPGVTEWREEPYSATIARMMTFTVEGRHYVKGRVRCTVNTELTADTFNYQIVDVSAP